MAYLKTTYERTYPDYIIKKKYQDKEIYISTTTTLSKNGWTLDLFHSLYLNRKPIQHWENINHEVDHSPLDIGRDLKDRTLLLQSTATRLPGGTDVPDVSYKVRLVADDEVIDEFEIGSSDNPANFYTLLTFRLEP